MIENRAKTKIFLHIPKTAGTTLYGILWRLYEGEEIYTIDHVNHSLNDFKLLPDERKEKIKMLTGHINFGIDQFLPQPATYFTFLRDPVALAISYFYYLRGELTHPHHQLAQSMSLEDYMDRRLDENMSNVQTRMLAGRGKSGQYYECTEADLETAKNNLQHAFAVVGLTDKFDETLVLLRQAYGWQNVYYARMNVTRNKPKRNAISQETLSVIKQANQLDSELYRFATDLFAEQVRQYGSSFNRDVQAFKHKNQRFYPFIYGYWHTRRQSTKAYRLGKHRLLNLYGRVRNRFNI